MKGEWVKVWWWRDEIDVRQEVVELAMDYPPRGLKVVCVYQFSRIFGVDVPADPFEPCELWLRGEASFERPDDDSV